MKLFEEFREYETMWDLVEAENSDQVAIENFFAQITRTPLDALQFIKEYLKVAIDKIGSDATSYDIGREFAKILLDKTDAQQEDVTLGNKYGYRAFLSKLADLDLTKYKVEQAILGDDAVINKMIARAGTRVSTAAKPVLTQYFNKITSSKDAAISFITLMSKYISDSNRNFNLAYNRAIVEETTDTKAYKIKTDPEHNYDAFLQAISVYGLNTKDVRTICNKGQARMNALEIFVEITDSVEAVKEFMRNLRQQYAELSDGSNTRMVYRLAYNKWFLANTNATVAGPNKIKPEEVNWNNFTETCWKKFGIAARDLTAFYRNELDAVPEVQSQDRHWTTASKAAKPTLEDYFSSITNDYDSAVFFIKEVLAPYANRRAKPDLASSYYSAMTNKTVATEPEIRKNPQCNYRAFKFAISKLGIYTKELEALIAT